MQSQDGTASQDITVTISGVNDAATISGATSGTVTEDSSPTTLTTSGTLTVSDVDHGEDQFSTTVTSAAGTVGTLGIATAGAWTYTVANQRRPGARRERHQRQLHRPVPRRHRQPDVTVTISGVNDAATISGDTTGAITEDSSPTTLTTTGTLTVSDVDTGEDQFETTVTPAAGAVGTFGITTDGAWTYSVDQRRPGARRGRHEL